MTTTSRATMALFSNFGRLLLLVAAALPCFTNAFGFHHVSSVTRNARTALYAAPIGPVARAKKLMDPKDYNRVVEQKMKRENLTRQQAEEEYNAFLENPSFYYALDKKEAYYKSLGYKDLLDGTIGEAEKEGRGDEVRERIEKFQRESTLKAYGVLAFFITTFWYVRSIYIADPDNFLPGI